MAGLAVLVNIAGTRLLERRRLSLWFPLLVLVSISTVTILLWQAIVAEERAQFEGMISQELQGARNELVARLESRIQALMRLGRRWEPQSSPARDSWEADAGLVASHFPSIQAIGWADTSHHVRWVVPRGGNEAALGLDLRFEERRRLAMDTAINRREVRLSRPIELIQGGKGFIAYLPLFRGDSFKGFMYGAFRYTDLFAAILANVAHGFSISISEDGETIYQRNYPVTVEAARWGQEAAIDFYGTTWRIRLTPESVLRKGMKTSLAQTVLAFGLALAVLLAVAVHLAQMARRRAKEAAAVNRELESEVAARRRIEADIAAHQEQLRFMTAEMSRIEEQERHRIAYALHDQIGQVLALAKIKLELMDPGDGFRREAAQISDLLDSAIRQTRTLTAELSPPILYELGLEAAVQSLCEEFQSCYRISFDFQDEGGAKPLRDELRTLLYQGVRELLVNIVKHSRASSVSVTVARDGEGIRITVTDNGIGFDCTARTFVTCKNGGFGLFSISERLDYLGGKLLVESAAGTGTTVTLLAPLRQHS